jgi:mannose-6-phosphate isomerase-like protein (cupin superfamily)
MSKLFDESLLAWQPVRTDVATGVFGRTLQDGKVKVVLTRVEPGGKFRTHRDAYAHLFYFLSGIGIVEVGDQKSDARVGVVVQIEAGEAHAYENMGSEDLVLISLNIPAN